MFVDKLESFDKSEGLVNWPTNGQVVDGNLSDDLVWIDDEQTTKRDSCIQKNAIVMWDFLSEISQQRVFNLSNSSLLSGRVAPSQVGEMRVNRNTDNLSV